MSIHALKITLFYLIVLLLPVSLCHANIDNLQKLPFKEKVVAANKLFDDHVARLDSVKVVATLTSWARQAKQHDDNVLEALAYNYLGVFYWRRDDSIQAIQYCGKAISLAEETKEDIIKSIALHNLGYQYYKHGKYGKGFECMLRSNRLMDSAGYSKFPNVTQYLYELADVYYTMRYFDKVMIYLSSAMNYCPPGSPYNIYINNITGLVYREEQQYDSAFIFFEKALRVAYKQNDTLWIGVTSGNLGSMYLARKDYNKAISLLKLDYSVSLRYGEWTSAANAMLTLANVYIENGQLSNAHNYLDSSSTIVMKNGAGKDIASWKQRYFKILSRIYSSEQKWQQSYAALDSESTYRLAIVYRDNANLLNRIESKLMVEKHLSERQLAETEMRASLLRRNAIIIVLLLSVILISQMFYRLRLKKRNADQEITSAKLLLESYTDRLQQNAILIENLSDVNKQKEGERPETDELDNIITQLYSSSILNEEEWREFKKLFTKVHGEFLMKLERQYPEMTQSETRFIALMKLGLSINAMANVLGVSPASVRKTRYRLLKKLDISEEELKKIVGPRKK